VYERESGAYRQIDVAGVMPEGMQFGALRMSGDGTVIGFAARCMACMTRRAISRIFLHDPAWNRTAELLSWPASADNFDIKGFSRDGRFVLFVSVANLVPDDRAFLDVFVMDRFTGSITRVSRGGVAPDGHSYEPSITPDGLRVAV